MKTRTHIVIATSTLLIAASVAAWPQQRQGGKSEMPSQQAALEHSRPSTFTGDAYATPANSTTRPNKATAGSVDSIDVVGHVAFNGAVISNIRTTEDQTRQLLEVTDKTNQTINTVDVANPGHPQVVQRMRKPAELQNSRLEVAVGDAALFAEMQDTTPKPRSISIVSFADHADSKTVRRFENVTALWADRGRGSIYLANPEGLWILQPHSAVDRTALQKQYDEWLQSSTAQ
jgi:hypothetical protein